MTGYSRRQMMALSSLGLARFEGGRSAVGGGVSDSRGSIGATLRRQYLRRRRNMGPMGTVCALWPRRRQAPSAARQSTAKGLPSWLQILDPANLGEDLGTRRDSDSRGWVQGKARESGDGAQPQLKSGMSPASHGELSLKEARSRREQLHPALGCTSQTYRVLAPVGGRAPSSGFGPGTETHWLAIGAGTADKPRATPC